jgi:hypothetical protein
LLLSNITFRLGKVRNLAGTVALLLLRSVNAWRWQEDFIRLSLTAFFCALVWKEKCKISPRKHRFAVFSISPAPIDVIPPLGKRDVFDSAKRSPQYVLKQGLR